MGRDPPGLMSWVDLQARRDGDPVVVDGYLHPVERGAWHDYFVLGPDAPCCFGCLPRDPARAIEVVARSPIRSDGGRLRLSGTLRRPTDDEAGFRFQLHDAQRLDAPGRALGRRALLGAGPLLCVAASAPAARAQPAPDLSTARAQLANAQTVDMHSHAGGLSGPRRVDGNVAFTPVADPMRRGGMAVSCLAIVSDGPVHRVGPDRRIHPFRDPRPGELYAFGTRSFERLRALVAEQGLRVVLTAADLRGARAEPPGAVVSAEGADFLEGDLSRVDEAHARWGLRHLQLTHYRPNELGDIQTEPPVHGGLTAFGADVIQRCNALGIVVDVAHGTLDLVRRAAEVTRKPLVLSHTSLSPSPSARSRLIAPDHARLIASTGGVIGIWPPAGRFPTMAALAAGMAAMVEVVGVDHVGLGSDMLGLVGPAVFRDYDDTPALAAALLDHGFTPADMRKLLGGNYVRVFSATLA